MSSDRAGAGSGPDEHPDRLRWNAKYGGDFAPSFAPHPLAVRALSMELPDGPVAELACGPSGAPLLAAANGRRVTAVDVSEVALGMLGDQARRRGLDHLITLVPADLAAWRPRRCGRCINTRPSAKPWRFWWRAIFRSAAAKCWRGGCAATTGTSKSSEIGRAH